MRRYSARQRRDPVANMNARFLLSATMTNRRRSSPPARRRQAQATVRPEGSGAGI
jgi:hypothetical protein